MTNKSNTNYTDGQRVLDFLLNPANYYACYDCYDGNHGWSGDVDVSDADTLRIIEGDRNNAKFMWVDNRTMDFTFSRCVENTGVWKDSLNLWDYRLYVEDKEALAFLKLEDQSIYTTNNQRLQLGLDEEEAEAFFVEGLGWDEDRLAKACEEVYVLYYEGRATGNPAWTDESVKHA